MLTRLSKKAGNAFFSLALSGTILKIATMKALLTSLALLSAPLFALPESASLAEALPVAQKEKRAIMLNFTGTDWCTACIHLRTKILDSAEFDAALGDKLLLVEIDYPRTPELVNKISKEEWQRRENLLVSYRAHGLPYAVLMDEHGYPFATINGASRTTADYLPRIRQALAIREARDEALSKASRLSGAERAQALVDALNLLPEACRDKYPDLIREITEADPEDKWGYRKYLCGTDARISQMNDLRELLSQFRGKFQPEQLQTNIELLDEFLSRPDLDPDVRQEALRAKADSYAFLRDIPSMVRVMKEAYNVNPDSRLGKKLAENIRYAEEQLLPMIQAEQAADKK